MSPKLILGPLLRHAGATEATIWVETDQPCTVSVLGFDERTFSVRGHHYALVAIRDLTPGEAVEYDVSLDGEVVWPIPQWEFGPSVICPVADGAPVNIAFGSCRTSYPHAKPFTLRSEDHKHGRETDALLALSRRIQADPAQRPDALLLLGDQVYADEVSPTLRVQLRAQRDLSEGAGDTIADFEEYTQLYREAWSSPPVRWLLSTIPTAMIFDDHDVIDDWNTSASWVEDMRELDWWHERIVGAYMSYWLYQHLGNLPPDERAADPVYERVRAGDEQALHELAERAEREVEGSRWSYHRDIGCARVVVIDSRAGRVLEPRQRRMVDDEEFEWVRSASEADGRHVLLATSLPWLLSPALHHIEAWNEAVCDGAWGGIAARLGEKLRRAMDLEHWAAFNRSFHDLAELIADLGAGRRGAVPASICVLSGDVHHAYLSEVAYPRAQGVRAPVWQAVCSPLRNPLSSRERFGISLLTRRLTGRVAGLLSRSASVGALPIRWRLAHDRVVFDNQVATLQLTPDAGRFVLERATPELSLTSSLELELARSATANLGS